MKLLEKGQLNLSILHNAFGRTINLPVKSTLKHMPAQNCDEISVGSEDIFNKSAVVLYLLPMNMMDPLPDF